MAEKNENPSTALGAGNKSDAALREETVLEFWKENKIFEKSVKQTEGKKEFVFYDGPVTANSKPVLHTMVPFSFKDVIPRYKTMRGFHVRRKGGWDTHGLPVELQIEKKLGFKSKIDIENYGIAAFNKLCKESVWEYIGLWKNFTQRMGYWADQENPYVTYHNEYIESLWNVLKKVDDQKLLYKDYKVVPWCPRCGTALSSHELAQGYEDVKDLSVYVKFKVKGQRFKDTFVLAWTTTPWTLPGNVALAVGKNIKYSWVQSTNDLFIVASDLVAKLFTPETVLVKEEFYGHELIDLEYEQLFPYFTDTISNSEKPKLEKAFKVYVADFVNTTDGTGIVHTAVMYGQDDFVLGTQVGLPKHHLVNLEGKFIKGTGFLEGRFVREVNPDGKPTLAVDIIEDLKKRNLFFKQENYKHSYPHCWRCKTALIYYARDSWYIRMSDPKIKEQLISENKKINWEPEHIREGRFGEWLKDIKDWAISRERYWGTPLPVWQCVECKKTEVIGSISDLKNKTKKSGNTYFIMRHGETTTNLKSLVSTIINSGSHLTEKGKAKTKEAGERLKKEGIDMIITSPFNRTMETSKIVKEALGLREEDITVDKRLGEMNARSYEGRPWMEYHNDFPKTVEYFDKAKDGDESYKDVRTRSVSFLLELEEKYKNKKILIVTHGTPAWMMSAGARMLDVKNTLGLISDKKDFHYFENSEIQKLPFVTFPHNEDFELDLHKPYIDNIALSCECGGDLARTREVMDVWFDSGCMPFAQDHYPFDSGKILYPADFISEAIDQTRGWFYTLHAVGTLMGRGAAYKNVICLGHLLDAKGKKMSKSIGNVVDPWEAMDKYGVDTLRLWMYSVNQPGESKNFDEKTVALISQQVFGLLYNVLAFYELYRDKNLETHSRPRSKNILDTWILAKLDELIKLSTKNLDNYKLLEPVRGLRDFIGDLSTWYLRRSRDRIKGGDADAKVTLYLVLKTLAKLMAPFAPFTAEDIWLKLKNEKDVESVHLESWPRSKMFNFGSSGVLESMSRVRDVVTLGLEARQKAGIKVRQPLASLKCKVESVKLSSEFIDLIKDELNVKDVIFDGSITQEVEIDTNITPALKAEGDYREFMRELQDERKSLGLNPGDKMPLTIEKIYKKYKIMPNLQEHMLRVAAVSSMICDNFTEAVSKEEIMTACLLHDMGNIIKFKLDSFPEFLEPEGLEYWENVRKEYIEKYGDDEIKASIKIIKELGLSEKIIALVGQVEFSFLCKHRDGDDVSMKITHYSDGRVDPHGVLSYQGRMDEAKKRYQNRKGAFAMAGEEERKKFVACGKDIERQIFSKCKIKPEDINNETVASVFLSLRNFVIK